MSYVLLFLFGFISNLAERFWGISFTENVWVNAIMWGLSFAGILKAIEWIFCKKKKEDL